MIFRSRQPSEPLRLLEEQVPSRHALDPVLENGDVEVDQQAEMVLGHLEVSQQLRLVNRLQLGDGLEFDDERFLNQKIQPIAAVQENSLVGQRHLLLSLETDARLAQLKSETFFVSRLQQSRP